jgi:hypothetical protein
MQMEQDHDSIFDRCHCVCRNMPEPAGESLLGNRTEFLAFHKRNHRQSTFRRTYLDVKRDAFAHFRDGQYNDQVRRASIEGINENDECVAGPPQSID